ncbi:MAG: hypothetical protein ACE5JI_11360, partial [Acidobacteriota bacterium]
PFWGTSSRVRGILSFVEGLSCPDYMAVNTSWEWLGNLVDELTGSLDPEFLDSRQAFGHGCLVPFQLVAG